MCAEGPSNHGEGSHPLRHAHHKAIPPAGVKPGDMMPCGDAVQSLGDRRFQSVQGVGLHQGVHRSTA